jgi:hypothetical protein
VVIGFLGSYIPDKKNTLHPSSNVLQGKVVIGVGHLTGKENTFHPSDDFHSP